MTTEQIRGFLRSSPLLHPLSEELVAKLAARARLAQWARNQVIVRKGDPGDAMMIVVTGRVKITSVADSGRERILNIIEPGESFGEMALLDGEPRCADAVALEPTTALVLGRPTFEELLRSEPAFAQQIIADLCRRLRKTTTLLEDSLFLDPTTRVARRLRAMIHETGRPPRNGTHWTLQGLSQQDLADAVGLTRESVNKVLSTWRSEGIVELERRTIVVHNLARIHQMARIDV
ncbi:MAG TPA: Crp/Fnr family transcriptional regulator [Candidatus Limnocylindrales bacterium]|nr:Crp/Fnr family transcriptional regulator [Candidatus Limnocylindrales bacterium]